MIYSKLIPIVPSMVERFGDEPDIAGKRIVRTAW